MGLWGLNGHRPLTGEPLRRRERSAGGCSPVHAQMELIQARERARRLAVGLVGRTIPTLTLKTFNGTSVNLSFAMDDGVVIYLYPGADSSPDGGSESRAADDAQHQSFERHRDDLEALSFKAVGVSGEPALAQLPRVLEAGVRHELWSDPDRQLARALGLPTFEQPGASGYRRGMLVVDAGVVEKAFYPVDSPEHSAAQVISWLKATGY
jgi:peroxiredoxin